VPLGVTSRDVIVDVYYLLGTQEMNRSLHIEEFLAEPTFIVPIGDAQGRPSGH
jgi:hypothetical protein